jgi:hypothetical protein
MGSWMFYFTNDFRFKEMPKVQPRSLLMMESNVITTTSNLFLDDHPDPRPTRGRRGRMGFGAAMGSRQGVILQYFAR